MKAVIVELRGRNAAALCDDGCVRQLRNKQYTVGQTVLLSLAVKMHSRFALRAACVAAVIALAGIPAYAYCTPYSYVSLDVNPSVEYSLNRFDLVLSCHAVNGDAEVLLEDLHLKHKNISEAVRLTLGAMADKGYLTADESGTVIITASSRNEKKSGMLTETLSDTAEAAAEEESITIEVEANGVGQERVQAAMEFGITPGKLRLIEELQESAEEPSSVKVEDWADKAVKEIKEKTKENKASKNSEGASSGVNTKKQAKNGSKNSSISS